VQRRIQVVTLIDLIGPIGGAERLAVLLAKGYDPAKVRSTIVVSRLDRDDPEHEVMFDSVRELEDAGVTVVGLARQATKDLRPWRRFGALLRDLPADVLHTHKFGSNVWGTAIGRLARTPVVVAHEHTWSFEGMPVRRFLDREVIGRFADAFVAVSREDRRRMIEIERIKPEKVVYIPNGAPPSPGATGADVRAPLGIAPDAPVVVSVGMLRRQKAFEVLVAAAGPLRERHPDVQVLIVGYGDCEDELTALIAEQGLVGTVRLVGHRDDVPDLLRAADVAVCSSDYEGMPISVLEYMEAGLPTVSTRVGGIPDMIDDGVEGVLVEPRDPAALAAALGDLLDDPDRRRAMGARAAARRQAEFGIDTMVGRLEELYRELLLRAGRRLTA
jgi:glycosyltransferase involved in cell wall biosynthesis